VNGDGYADMVFGAFANVEGAVGQSLVYLGGPDGLATSPATTLVGSTVEGASYHLGAFAGLSSSHGDYDGDGYADVVVGADFGDGTGTVYVLPGGPAGVASTPVTTLPSTATIEFGSSIASRQSREASGDPPG
jgi:hypothetical protein